jgi:hypothetical protein
MLTFGACLWEDVGAVISPTAIPEGGRELAMDLSLSADWSHAMPHSILCALSPKGGFLDVSDISQLNLKSNFSSNA